LLDNPLDGELLAVVLRVLLQLHDDFGAAMQAVAGADRVGAVAVGEPFVALAEISVHLLAALNSIKQIIQIRIAEPFFSFLRIIVPANFGLLLKNLPFKFTHSQLSGFF
jgi:hypothetical protein